ncbi:YHS domain-containing (seleno)protein [Tenacibaculum sp. TC6]|uniref:YHS domain-containing (seleno)protein n=1 Tax=Tenacibaculum sp. TC6 TaxID=3423223 RepID=UPI003D35B6E3
MKKLILLFVFITSFAQAQSDYNLKKGAIANGYDVVAYFNNKAEKGSKKYTTTYEGALFKFSSEKNLETFKKAPQKYIPQYGGYCAYAIGKTGEKVDINPKTFEIRNGKLYLFYNSWGTNTLTLWLQENPDELQKQADKNWRKLNQ